MTIREAIREILKGDLRDRVRIGTVKAGTVAAGLCTVIPIDGVDDNGSEELLGVRIQAAVNTKGIKPIPADGSFVIVAELAPFDYCIILYSDLASLQFMDGSYGGLTKTQELQTQLAKMNDQVKAIHQALTTWVVVPSDGGAALKAAAVAGLAGKPDADFTAIENDKITHGAP